MLAICIVGTVKFRDGREVSFAKTEARGKLLICRR